ncbi:hypothetical protein Trydic_g8698 [Trypoxylus dichotomus]
MNAEADDSRGTNTGAAHTQGRQESSMDVSRSKRIPKGGQVRRHGFNLLLPVQLAINGQSQKSDVLTGDSRLFSSGFDREVVNLTVFEMVVVADIPFQRCSFLCSAVSSRRRRQELSGGAGEERSSLRRMMQLEWRLKLL